MHVHYARMHTPPPTHTHIHTNAYSEKEDRVEEIKKRRESILLMKMKRLKLFSTLASVNESDHEISRGHMHDILSLKETAKCFLDAPNTQWGVAT